MLPLTGTSFQYVKLMIYVATYLRKSQVFDLRSVNYASLSYTTSTYQGIVKLSFQMSADGTTWVACPTGQEVAGQITFNPAPWSGYVDTWAEDVHGGVSATLHLTNNSAGASIVFEYRVRIISQIGTDPVSDSPGTYTTAATLSNGQSYSGTIVGGVIQSGTSRYEVYVYAKESGGTEQQIGYHKFI